MGKLVDYFDKNPGKFLPEKHQNEPKTEAQHKQIIRHYLEYAENLGIYHTGGLKEKVLVEYIKQKKWKTQETKRKHKIWLFKAFKKLNKKEVSDYAKSL